MDRLNFIDFLKRRVSVRSGKDSNNPVQAMVVEIEKMIPVLETKRSGKEIFDHIHFNANFSQRKSLDKIRMAYKAYCRHNNMSHEII